MLSLYLSLFLSLNHVILHISVTLRAQVLDSFSSTLRSFFLGSVASRSVFGSYYVLLSSFVVVPHDLWSWHFASQEKLSPLRVRSSFPTKITALRSCPYSPSTSEDVRCRRFLTPTRLQAEPFGLLARLKKCQACIPLSQLAATGEYDESIAFSAQRGKNPCNLI